MIKLALAAAFLAVFGLIGWALIVYLIKAFPEKENKQQNQNNKTNEP